MTDREKHRAARRDTGPGYPDAVAADVEATEELEAAKAEPAAEWPRTIRTTMEPHREYQVGESEYLDLQAQGLLSEEGK